MYRTTMGSIEQIGTNSQQETRMHFLYLVRDGDTVLYAGRSFNPIERLRQHMGIDDSFYRTDTDRIGRLFFYEKPESLEWQVEMYTIADCLSSVRRHIISQFPFYTEQLYLSEVGIQGAISFAEQALIQEHHPCLNVIHNDCPTPLPIQYKWHTRGRRESSS